MSGLLFGGAYDPLHRRSLRGAIVLAVFCATFMDSDWLHAEEQMTFTLKSPAFENGNEIPPRYTCDGTDIAPPLVWDGVPVGTRSLVLIVDDPDAPDPRAPKMVWVHWVLYNIPPDTAGLPAAVKSEGLPAGTKEGINDWRRTGYGGPCPPIGRHRYFHKLYALDVVLDRIQKPTKTAVEAAMRGHVVAETELVGTYQKAD